MIKQAPPISEKKLSSSGKVLLKRIHTEQQEGYQREEFYEDNGCEVSSKCLECPLSQCKYDDAWAFDEMRRHVKDLYLCTLIQTQNLSVNEAAKRLKVTERTIFRTMARVRKSKIDNTLPDIQILLDVVRKEYDGI